MKRRLLDLTLVALCAPLLNWSGQDVGVQPTPVVPVQAPVAKQSAGALLTANEKKRDKGVLVVYALQAEGLPHDKKYGLTRTSMGGQTVDVARDVRLDKSGRVVKADGGGIDLGLGMMFAGESVVFTLASEDGAASAAVEITPFPLQAEGGTGCRLTLRPMSIKGDRFQVIGEGFKTEQPVTVVGSEAGEVTPVPLKPNADGRLTAIVTPVVASKSGGDATLTASDGSCSVTVGYSWGDAMVKRPSSSTQSSGGITRSIEQAAPGMLPEAPTGFHWAQATVMKGAFLVPDGWFFRADQSQTRLTYFVTRTDTHLGKFKVGLTVNVNRGAKGDDPVAYAQKLVEAFSTSKGKTLRKKWAIKSSQLSGAGCDVDFGVGDEALVMELIMLGNPETNALYFITFEAPKDEWEGAWKLGREIVSHIKLSDNF